MNLSKSEHRKIIAMDHGTDVDVGVVEEDGDLNTLVFHHLFEHSPAAGSAAGKEMDIATIKKIRPSHFSQQEKFFIGLTMPHSALHTDATA